MEISEIKLSLLNRMIVKYKDSPYYIVALSLCVPDADRGKIGLLPEDSFWQVTLHDLKANSVIRVAPSDIISTGETLAQQRRRMNKGGNI